MSQSDIKKWQTVIGVPADGDFGPATLLVSLRIAGETGIYTPPPPPKPGEITGQSFLDLATTRIGEEYVYGADVPLNDPNWHGPWDCAEFVTWVVRQVTGKIYGCVDNNAANPDPYTGGWKQEVVNGSVNQTAIGAASKVPGGILLRFRQGGKHIVFATGDGGTIEAKGTAYGVCRGTVGNLSSWDYGILIPGVKY